MRLVFKATILDRIHDALADAVAAGKQVERIVLSRSEMRELQDLPIAPTKDDPHGQHYPTMKDTETFIDGIPVSEEPIDPAKQVRAYVAPDRMHQ